MALNNPHQPKQAAALLQGTNRVTIYETTGGTVTSQFASHNLSLIPPIPSGSIVHDNACGAGTVSRIILSSNPTSNLAITATDTDQMFLDALQQDVAKKSWPITVSNMRAESLTFPDNHFTHSMTNIGIFFTTSAGLDGAKEIYRTLQPGGTAIVNCWQDAAWFIPFRLVNEALRPGKAFPQLLERWKDGSHLQNIMLEAGFQREDMRVERSEVWMKASQWVVVARK
ncbi:S-adenosyl-L-methionine-dependent methyltransferase [Plenodomus tracheiphilus IPT5]|uniref:S-adenosyl-L-methionine-dependent methyltransferase n=1 Tax=Plenodomus tracheiphilus IPT5 TaxID=1408161 RepID=A0A6A7AYG7_9PLEO|nr:S-adenosyl-L-methionine-dependent methyltransferase [Plenodomus tracheiphilus IPT5]